MKSKDIRQTHKKSSSPSKKPNFKVDLFVCTVAEIFIFSFLSANAIRVKRQDDKSEKKSEESFEQELCKDKDAGEWFRLVANDGDSCRDVIQCTTSVSLLRFVHIIVGR